MKNELKKLGLRVRARVVEAQKPGRIAFDERGNAIYSWDDVRLQAEGEAGETARRKALEYAGLSIVDEEVPSSAPIRSNPKGLRVGYNPYESGLLAGKQFKKKRDLRELSKWMETKKKAQGNDE